jgi:hypothetical protein
MLFFELRDKTIEQAAAFHLKMMGVNEERKGQPQLSAKMSPKLPIKTGRSSLSFYDEHSKGAQ